LVLFVGSPNAFLKTIEILYPKGLALGHGRMDDITNVGVGPHEEVSRCRS
jgi:hypothetical protein